MFNMKFDTNSSQCHRDTKRAHEIEEFGNTENMNTQLIEN